tara:strand:+ start:222 stop:509 length:288 start_codon:yes stop_codon:yes gene_type:complete
MAAQQFTLMIVRKRYVSPYRKYKYVAMDGDSMTSKKKFISALEEKSTHWRDATYFLMSKGGVFSRFDIEEGKVVKLYKHSPVTDLVYPCWEGFKK